MVRRRFALSHRGGDMRRAVLAVLVVSLAAAAPASAAVRPDIRVLSNRADLVSGGDALVRVVPPRGFAVTRLRVQLNGSDVTSAFAKRASGQFTGVLENLRTGRNVVRARAGRKRSQLVIRNHPIGGPVLAGPQIQPWKCNEGALDAQCNRPPEYEFLYRSTAGGTLRAYDPDNPPADVATTTTDQGNTVPFIVRQETGVLDRDEYRIAVLYDPSKPFTATDPQDGFNHKLVITHGASCDTEYQQADAPDVLNETALGRGFAVMSHALDNAGHNCNIVTEAESLIMTKERVIDRYGTIRYTIGSGCSGGSLVQQQVANAYPGLYQGITPACSFADAWASAMQYVDYELLRRYFENPTVWGTGVVWTPDQIAAVQGHASFANAITFTSVIPSSGNPTRPCTGVPDEQVYDAQTNPKGVRCSFQDYMVNVFGRRPQDGFAGRPFDNVGIEYGRTALAAGKITPAQFADLNAKIGAGDIDYNPTTTRAEADRPALERAYRSGAVNQGDNLDEVPIIDLRGPDPGAFHDVYRTYVMRARLEREHGTSDNQILWRGQAAIVGDTTFTDDAIIAMDEWLANIEKDKRKVPLSQKVLEDKPESLGPRCTDGNGTDIPAAECDAVVQAYGDPRIAAGMPLADDTMKCELKLLRRTDYVPAMFGDPQWEQMQAAFPKGVCDYTRPGVDRVPTSRWQTYQRANGEVIYGGRPLGARPKAVPFGCARGASKPYARVLHRSVQRARRAGAGSVLRLRGIARVRKGCGRIVRVQVSVARKAGASCAFLRGDGGFGAPRACKPARYLRARGKKRWRFASRRALPAGVYDVRVRSVDARGKRSPVSRKRHTAVTITLR
jgi:hypothetical protein